MIRRASHSLVRFPNRPCISKQNIRSLSSFEDDDGDLHAGIDDEEDEEADSFAENFLGEQDDDIAIPHAEHHIAKITSTFSFKSLKELEDEWLQIYSVAIKPGRSVSEVPTELFERIKSLIGQHKLDQLLAFNDDYKAKLVQITHRLLGGSKIDPIRYSWRETAAYLALDFVPAYSVSKQIFENIVTRLGPENEQMKSYKTVLDFASGPGTGTLAAKEAFPQLSCATLIDPSKSMWEVANVFIQGKQDFSRPIEELVSEMKAKKEKHFTLLWSPSIPEYLKGYKAGNFPQHDVVTCMFSLRELTDYSQRMVAMSYLWRFVKPGGILVVAERGDRLGSQMVLEARTFLLERDPETGNTINAALGFNPFDGEPIQVIAPCTHSKACPFVNNTAPVGRFNDKCIFVTQTEYTIAKNRKGATPKTTGNAKYTYVVFQKFKNELPDYSRILRIPMKRNSHIHMDVCDSDGTIKREAITKKRAKKTPLYRIARKAVWGGMWRTGLMHGKRIKRTKAMPQE